MRYMGGKARIAKQLSSFLNDQMQPGDNFYDLFCGALNVTSKIRSDVNRHANDINSELISLWEHLKSGGDYPRRITEDEYKAIRKDISHPAHERAFYGFGMSFAGKYFGGFARGGNNDYYSSCINSCNKKISNCGNVLFSSGCYSRVRIKYGSTVYCDIPYKDTTQYSAVGNFDHDPFYEWLITLSKRSRIFVSEYAHNVPSFGEIVLEIPSKKSMRNSKGDQIETREVLWCVKSK